MPGSLGIRDYELRADRVLRAGVSATKFRLEERAPGDPQAAVAGRHTHVHAAVDESRDLRLTGPGAPPPPGATHHESSARRRTGTRAPAHVGSRTSTSTRTRTPTRVRAPHMRIRTARCRRSRGSSTGRRCRPRPAIARTPCSGAWRRPRRPSTRCRSSTCTCTRSARSTRSSTSSARCSRSSGSAPTAIVVLAAQRRRRHGAVGARRVSGARAGHGQRCSATRRSTRRGSRRSCDADRRADR